MLGGAANELILWELKAKAVKSGRVYSESPSTIEY
jgi:hypothetical protein